jgi:hypothetical protein
MRSGVLLGLVAGVLMVLPSVAAGQGRTRARVDQAPTKLKALKQAGSPRVVVVRGPNGKKKILFKDPMDIVGTLHRPHAAYLLGRSKLDYAWAGPHKSLVQRIPPTVRRKPF